jgi:hypothetical protein
MGNWIGLLIDRKVDPNEVIKPLDGGSILGGGQAEG